MDIVERVKAILLKPAETWPVIEQEATDIGRIYKEVKGRPVYVVERVTRAGTARADRDRDSAAP